MIALFSWMPEQASDIATRVDLLFFGLLAVCGMIAFAVAAAVIIFCVRYRAGSAATHARPRGSVLGLELLWTSATTVLFLAIFGAAAAEYRHMTSAPANAVEVHVVAKQWMWKLQHPDGRREINELHLLIGRPVKLVMTSQDVIHSFFIPAFRTKQDVLPDRYTTEWFTPTKAGRYHLFCAEYCGMDHSRMGGWIEVMEPAAYAQWLAAGGEGETVVAAGARLFTARGCAGCHAPGSKVRAPLLNGLYGRPVALNGGQVQIADEQYLHDSILLPNKQITAGYEPLMPTYQGQLGEEDVLQLIAYIKSLSGDPESAP